MKPFGLSNFLEMSLRVCAGISLLGALFSGSLAIADEDPVLSASDTPVRAGEQIREVPDFPVDPEELPEESNTSPASVTESSESPAAVSSATGEEAPNCPICLDELDASTALASDALQGITTPCGHSFHRGCLRQIQNSKCPLCRAPLSMDSLFVEATRSTSGVQVPSWQSEPIFFSAGGVQFQQVPTLSGRGFWQDPAGFIWGPFLKNNENRWVQLSNTP